MLGVQVPPEEFFLKLSPIKTNIISSTLDHWREIFCFYQLAGCYAMVLIGDLDYNFVTICKITPLSLEETFMPKPKKWSREETIMAFNLYCKTQFGKMHSRNPQIRKLAEKMGRTSGSLAMKLTNFASLDPALNQKGLTNISKLDKQIWNEFHSDWTTLALESERLLSELSTEELITKTTDDSLTETPYLGSAGSASNKSKLAEETITYPHEETEYETTTRQRRGQSFFRNVVLASYDYKCAITGCPIPQLLIASHILPWATYPQHRVNPRNGICLIAHFDKAFDNGLISFDNEYRLILSPIIKEYLPDDYLEEEIIPREGIRMKLPCKFAPEKKFLEMHHVK